MFFTSLRFRHAMVLRLCAALAFTPAAFAADLSVEVTGHQASGGQIRVALFKDGATFLKTPMAGLEAPAAEGPVVLVFKNLPAGTYALSAYHDENGNDTLDRGLFRIPTERYGFSQDARGDGGPPLFRDAQVEVREPGSHTSIKLR
jgi:uncharacterized protein (DUF2141 family)